MSLRYRLVRALAAPLSRLAHGLGDEQRFYLLGEIGQSLLPRYPLKWPQIEWWKEERFAAYLQKFSEENGFNADRRIMVSELLRLVDGVAGDTAECGVFQGAGSYLICAANEPHPERVHHVFDSFEGLSAPTDHDAGYWEPGDLAFGLEGVRQNLASFARVEYHKGWIPERFADVEGRKFSFVHIDVDLAQPTRDSIEFFYPRLADGGIILCDDYGFETCPGATQMIDAYLADKPEKMVRLSGGGGFMIKGLQTGRPPLSNVPTA
jgi:O-methyltransferase